MADIPLYPVDPDDPGSSIFKNEDLINRRMVEMIDVGFNMGMPKVTLFQVTNMDNGETDMFLNLPDDQWEDNLRSAITYFEGIEDYEMCSYAKDVLDRISG